MQVLKFSNDGSELVMRLGEPDHPKTREEARANPDPGPYTFGWPSKLAFLPDGSFYLGTATGTRASSNTPWTASI